MTERPQPAWREYLEALLVAGLFLGFTNTFVLKTFYIPSGSMENTLLVGDHLIVNRFVYGHRQPAAPLLPSRPLRRGDVVVFRSPEDPRIDLVKRLVGLPGDVVEVRDKRLYLNGHLVRDEVFAVHRDPLVDNDPDALHPQRDNFGPVTVPPERYFFLGDNRDFSYDSRSWGPAPAHYVKGRAFLIYWSNSGETPDGTPRPVAARLAQVARTAFGFFGKTRWERSFRVVR